MANNIVGGAPNAVVCKQTVSFVTAGINNTNTEIIYLVDDPLKSYVPGRAINGISGFEENKGYYFVAKIDMDLTAYLVPPLDAVTPSTNVVDDTFDGTAGTNLTAHTPTEGGAITKVWGQPGNITVQGDGTAKLTSSSTATHYAYANVFAGANQRITMKVKRSGLSAGITDAFVVCLRSDITTTNQTGYELQVYDDGVKTYITLYRVTDGTAVALYGGTPVDVPALRNGSYHDVTLEANGSTLTITLDGSTIFTTTDTGLTAGRKAVVGGYTISSSDATNWVCDSVIAQDV